MITKTILTFILITLFSSTSYSQKIKKNEIDEFTKNIVIETDWSTFTFVFSGYSYFRVRKIDELTLLDLRFVLNDEYYSIRKGDKLMFINEDKEVYEVYAADNYMSCTGCGSVGLMGSKALGIRPNYIISDEIIDKMISKKIIKFRIYTTDGYSDFELSNKNYNKLKKALINVSEAYLEYKNAL